MPIILTDFKTGLHIYFMAESIQAFYVAPYEDVQATKIVIHGNWYFVKETPDMIALTIAKVT